jgi:hypothetical protein
VSRHQPTTSHPDRRPAPAKRVISAVPASPQEEAIERALRPKLLQEYVGQAKAREQLEIFIGAATKRGEALDHVLLFGPPGPGQDHAQPHHRGRTGREPAPDQRARCWKSPRTWRRC